MKNLLLSLAVIALCGCERPVPPDDCFLYSTINQNPDGSFIRIGVKIERWEKQLEMLDYADKKIALLRERIDKLETEKAENEEKMRIVGRAIHKFVKDCDKFVLDNPDIADEFPRHPFRALNEGESADDEYH